MVKFGISELRPCGSRSWAGKGVSSFIKILGVDNPAGAMTKHLAGKKLNGHLTRMNARFELGRPTAAPSLSTLGWCEGLKDYDMDNNMVNFDDAGDSLGTAGRGRSSVDVAEGLQAEGCKEAEGAVVSPGSRGSLPKGDGRSNRVSKGSGAGRMRGAGGHGSGIDSLEDAENKFCKKGQGQHVRSGSRMLKRCLKRKHDEMKHGVNGKHGMSARGKTARRDVVWADCDGFDDAGKDAYQLVGAKVVRFAGKVGQMVVTPYSAVYGMHPRLFHFDRDGRQVLSNHFSFDPYEVQTRSLRRISATSRRVGAEGERIDRR